jgi:hypothetical protein
MKRRLLVIVTMTATLLVASVGYAGAAGRGASGHCSGSSTYQLTVSRGKTSTLNVKFVVSNAKRGSSWQLFGSDNGDRIFALTKAASNKGTVAVAKTIANLPGADTVKASGYDTTSGETCIATVIY